MGSTRRRSSSSEREAWRVPRIRRSMPSRRCSRSGTRPFSERRRSLVWARRTLASASLPAASESSRRTRSSSSLASAIWRPRSLACARASSRERVSSSTRGRAARTASEACSRRLEMRTRSTSTLLALCSRRPISESSERRSPSRRAISPAASPSAARASSTAALASTT